MLASRLRGPINKVAGPLGRAVAKTHLSANTFTVLGLVFVSLGTVLLAAGHLHVGPIIVGVGGVLDLVDGAVAKATHTESRFGAFLDSTTDRLSDGIFFSGCVWYLSHHPYAGHRLGIPPDLGLFLALGVLVLGFTISYIRGKAESLGYTCNVGIAERGERMLVVAVAIFFGLLVPSLALIFVLSAVTVGQRFVHVWQQAKR